MTLVKKPKDRGPLFGGRAQIMIGGPLVHQLREWKRRKETASSGSDEDQDSDEPPRP